MSVFNLEKELLGHFNQRNELMRILNISRSYVENINDQLQHSRSVTVSIGHGLGGRRREMFICTRLMEGALIGLTELGKSVFGSNEVKYPNGMVIEEMNGELLAGCRSGAKAAELLGVRFNGTGVIGRTSTSAPSNSGRFSSKLETCFNVRNMTNDDTLGVTRRGKELLTVPDDWVD